jgi:hypothetical protein
MAKKSSAKSRATREHWQEEPAAHDYAAASAYLSLLLQYAATASLVKALQDAPIVRRKAKDLLRASHLALLPETDGEVAGDLATVRRGQRLSPVLLIRGALSRDISLTVADGYHRICASYHLDENAEIPCRMADLPSK